MCVCVCVCVYGGTIHINNYTLIRILTQMLQIYVCFCIFFYQRYVWFLQIVQLRAACVRRWALKRNARNVTPNSNSRIKPAPVSALLKETSNYKIFILRFITPGAI